MVIELQVNLLQRIEQRCHPAAQTSERVFGRSGANKSELRRRQVDQPGYKAACVNAKLVTTGARADRAPITVAGSSVTRLAASAPLAMFGAQVLITDGMLGYDGGTSSHVLM